MPDPVKLISTIKLATQHLREQKGRIGKYIELQDVTDVLVAGDLHGHLSNFKVILQHAKLTENPGRHVVLQELVHGPFRYPDNGGELSHRLVDVTCAYICQYPGRVHYLLGNHELAQWTKREIAKNHESLNSLFVMGVATSYPDHVEELLSAYDELFAALPVAVRLPNRLFLSHSLPGAIRLKNWHLDDLKKPEFSDDDYKIGGSIHAVVWGRDTSESTVREFLKLVDADLLISGHIPSDSGYDTPNPLQIILDGKDEGAQILLFDANTKYNQSELLHKLIKLHQDL